MAYETVEVRKLSGCGAEVLGLDLNTMSNHQWDEVQRAFAEHGVVFFRDQKLTPEQHIAFARRWGVIDINRYFTAVEGYREIAEVRKEPDQQRNIGERWHTDHTYDQIPAMGSILVARDVPSKGGDTHFANICDAFDALSDGLKEMLRGINAVHSSVHIFGAKAKKNHGDLTFHNAEHVGDVIHPVVIRHPLSGREALYVNADFTIHFEGWSKEDSKPLLDYLYAHCTQDRFTSNFQWRPGSIAFWDNRATWHRAINDYQGERRLMHRITVGGCALEAAQKKN
jgi:taurine dioxygenase